ncbi:MAG: hypothetical protein JNJ57_12180 [Saprospiraceae bacterium]|nr:hypothetical protein [Saprospiraceae bacterium]
MKTKLFSLLTVILLTSIFSTITAMPANCQDDIKVVISEKKIWFVADEMPVKCLCIKVKDMAGKVVLEKCLSSKIADWSINTENLPKGDYTVEVGKDKMVKFKK